MSTTRKPERQKKSRKAAGVLMLLENNSFPSDRRMLHLARALNNGGYRVTVICPKGDYAGTQALHEVVDHSVVYRYPLLFGEASGKIEYLLEYSWGLLCMAVLCIVVLLRDGFDIIHAANPPDLLFLLAWPFKLIGKKFVYDQHDLCPELYESKFRRRGGMHRLLLELEKLSYRTADLVISTNQSYREVARERGRIPDSRSAIVRNGVDIGEFYRRLPRPELKRGFPYMAAYLGIMGTQDGVDRIVRAAKHLLHDLKRYDVLFLMIGKGECWEGLQELARELKVDTIMHFTGRIPDDLLLDYLSTADICLAPDPPDPMNNLSTMTKIMEYMACERPIVSFDLIETRRSAEDAAIYVSHDDPALFARAISDLLDDPLRRENMGRIGQQRTTHVVGLDKSCEALLAAYCRLQKESNTAGACVPAGLPPQG